MNTMFSYMYRDSANYKISNYVIISENLTLNEIQPFLHEGEFFIPSEVGLQDLQTDPFTVYDHIWHTIHKIERTEEVPNCSIDAQDIIRAFKIAHASNWNEYDVLAQKYFL